MDYSVVSYYDFYKKDWESLGKYHPSNKRKNKFIRGAFYTTKNNVSVDKLLYTENTEKIYQLKGLVHKINDTPIEGIILKNIDKETNNNLFSLDKRQCKLLHVKFENNLELFPMNAKLSRIIKKYPNTSIFNGTLETYPHCITDGSIRYILVECQNLFEKNNRILNTQGLKYRKIKHEDNITLSGLYVKANYDIYTENHKKIYSVNDNIKYNTIIKDNKVFLELIFKIPVKNMFTEDGYTGINKKSFKNFEINKLFSILDIRK